VFERIYGDIEKEIASRIIGELKLIISSGLSRGQDPQSSDNHCVAWKIHSNTAEIASHIVHGEI